MPEGPKGQVFFGGLFQVVRRTGPCTGIWMPSIVTGKVQWSYKSSIRCWHPYSAPAARSGVHWSEATFRAGRQDGSEAVELSNRERKWLLGGLCRERPPVCGDAFGMGFGGDGFDKFVVA